MGLKASLGLRAKFGPKLSGLDRKKSACCVGARGGFGAGGEEKKEFDHEEIGVVVFAALEEREGLRSVLLLLRIVEMREESFHGRVDVRAEDFEGFRL